MQIMYTITIPVQNFNIFKILKRRIFVKTNISYFLISVLLKFACLFVLEQCFFVENIYFSDGFN
jgi:hypothetical protein